MAPFPCPRNRVAIGVGTVSTGVCTVSTDVCTVSTDVCTASTGVCTVSTGVCTVSTTWKRCTRERIRPAFRYRRNTPYFPRQ